MTVYNFDKLFAPKSVAVIGASNRSHSVGALVMRNLIQGTFAGPIMPVNPKHQAIAGVLSYADVAALPIIPDLAIICTPPETVPAIISALAEKGTRACIVLTAGMARIKTPDGITLQDSMLEIARPVGMRIMGPNCLGLLVPGIGLNASFSHLPSLPGRIAFVSQSGAMCTAVLDWARAHSIGFSHFVSVGDSLDVDMKDVIDYLGSDPNTHAILLYIESIHKRRNFMSAARAAARNKPTLVIKSGRFAEGAKAAASHTGALAGSDIVYDSAFRRAGMLRVHDIEELFAAVETLARGRPLHGERLAIMTNGGGLGVMAVDDLIEGGGVLAGLSKKTLSALDSVLPETWSRSNPVDIIGDASGERYAATLKILSQDKGVDAVLVMHAPTGTASSTDAAQAVIDSASKTKTYILTSWVGGESVAQARNMFADTGIPTYATPDQAVNGFLHMVNYRRNQELLMETPLAAPTEFRPDVDKVRALVAEALKTETTMMREPEAKAVLAAYGIPTIETHIATTSRDAAEIARKLGFPVALKILSEDIPHKSDVGGVNLFLESPEAVRGAAEIMLETIAEKLPNCRIEGFTVQKMALRPGAHELIIGVASDPIFGPVILFGQGGTAVEIIADRAVALPPLNMRLARELIDRTRIVRLLTGYRDRPPIDMDALCLTLMQVSQLVIDIPELVELDINPLFADDKGVLALDARIGLDAKAAQIPQRLAIRPYPGELEEIFSMPSGRKTLLRPIRPEDEPQHYKFIASLSPEDIRFRFFGLVKTLPHSQMARFTQIDYDREMAFIASGVDEGGGNETLGVVRTITDPNNEATEFAIVVRSDLKGQGLGSKLLGKMIAYCKGRGTRRMVGQILRENHRMLELASKIGFQRHHIEDETAVEVTLDLTKATT